MDAYETFVSKNQGLLVIGIPWLFFFVLAALEFIVPHEKKTAPERLARWPRNFAATFFLVGIYAIVPSLVFFTAAWAREKEIGIFNLWPIPFTAGIAVTFVSRSFVGYWCHVAYHKIGWLWRFHLCHHSDYHLDVTTSGRFSFVEAFVGMIANAAIVLLLGLAPAWILVFEATWAVWNSLAHSNLSFPSWLERAVRGFYHTPMHHRIHHSKNPAEYDSNYGIVLSVWDRVFGTYRAELLEPDRYLCGSSDLEDGETRKLLPLLITGFPGKR